MGQKRDADDKAITKLPKVGVPARVLTAAAQRALAEAAERRAAAEQTKAHEPREIDGRGGKEPVRFGDWEVKGLATDF